VIGVIFFKPNHRSVQKVHTACRINQAAYSITWSAIRQFLILTILHATIAHILNVKWVWSYSYVKIWSQGH